MLTYLTPVDFSQLVPIMNSFLSSAGISKAVILVLGLFFGWLVLKFLIKFLTKQKG